MTNLFVKGHTVNKGRKQSIETIRKRFLWRPKDWKMSDATKKKIGIANFKGDDVGYYGIHFWLNRTFGKASRCENKKCYYPRMGAKKFFKKPLRFEWALLKGEEYKRVRSNFMQLCIACHRKYDAKQE